MRNQKRGWKTTIVTKEKRLETLHYRILIALMICVLITGYFFGNNTIGYDSRYYLYVFLLPILFGMLILGFYRKEFLIRMYLGYKKFYEKVFVVGFYLFQGIIISGLSFGQASYIIWNYLNKNEAEKQPTETLVCPVTEFHNGRGRASIDFEFQNRPENFKVTTSIVLKYKEDNPGDYVVVIEAKKGVWNYYYVENWNLKKK